MASRALISDFDGTITEIDFYVLIAQRRMPADAMRIWESYKSGKITHYSAMQAFFSHAPDDEASLQELLNDVRIDPKFAECAHALKAGGWDLIIVSAGCSWYVERLLKRARVKAVVHSNPGDIVPGKGLVMRFAADSPYFCPNVGIDKQALVRDALGRYERVAFAGDGPPDLGPALMVPARDRFARGFLMEELHRRGESFQPFGRWCEIVTSLLRSGNS